MNVAASSWLCLAAVFCFQGLRVLIAFSAVNARRSSHSTARTGLYVCCEAFRRYSAVIRVYWRSLCASAFKQQIIFSFQFDSRRRRPPLVFLR